MASFAKKPERYRLLLLGAMLLVAACNNPDQQHNVLNFFFDGVPDPNAQPETQTADPKLPGKRKSFEPVSLKRYLHEPYALKDCSDCHKSNRSQALLKPEPQLCYDCHGRILKKMTFVHKPAAEGNCKVCHLAHESPYIGLLPKPEIDLCHDCHEPDKMKVLPAHADMGQQTCGVCHDPHGSTRKGLLLDSFR